MAGIDIGSPAIDRTGSATATYTWVNKTNPANALGKITGIEFWVKVDLSNCEVATFFVVSGDNLSTRDTESIGSVTAGSKQTFVVDLDVEEGDYIGTYSTDGILELSGSGGDGDWSKSGDNIPCSDLLFSYTASRQFSLYGTGVVEFEYVGTGTFTYSGSGICQYEAPDWEYIGSGGLTYSGEATQSHTKYFLYDTSGNFVFSGTGIYSIGFAFTGGGSLTYSGEAIQTYTFNYLYSGSGELTYSGSAIITIGFTSIGSGTYNFSGVGLYSLGLFYSGIGEFVYSGSATQVYTRYYLYAGSGLFTYSGEAVLRWGDWAEITKEISDFTGVEKGESNLTKIDKEKGDWKKTIKL